MLFDTDEFLTHLKELNREYKNIRLEKSGQYFRIVAELLGIPHVYAFVDYYGVIYDFLDYDRPDIRKIVGIVYDKPRIYFGNHLPSLDLSLNPTKD